MPFKSLIQFVKRHPFFYKTRFRLLSRNSSWEAINHLDYNDLNPKDELPDIFESVNKDIFKDLVFNDDLEKVKHLCVWLRTHIKGGPGLSLPSDQALEVMLAGKGGVCSDFAQVFNNFCVVNGLRVREWGMTRMPFDNLYGGHSINEVYIPQLAKWVCMDVYLCLLFYAAELDQPLSVKELQQELLNNPEALSLEYFADFNDEIEKSILKNYKSSEAVMFLIHRYHNKIYDSYLRRFKPVLPTSVIHFMLYIKNRSYLYLFPHHDCKQLFVKS